MPFIKTVCIDFDGVLHKYDSKWAGAAVVADGPVAGAMAFLRLLAESPNHHPAVYSSRSKEPAGVEAMKRWIRTHLVEAFSEDVADRVLAELSFPIEKPAAWLTIDDRAIRFEGVFPTLAEIDGFTPWNKRPAGAQDGDVDDFTELATRSAMLVGRARDYAEALRAGVAEGCAADYDELAGMIQELWERLSGAGRMAA